MTSVIKNTIAFLLLLLSFEIKAQSDILIEWVRNYNVSDSLSSAGFDVDAHGCIALCGITRNSITGISEMTVLRYSPEGELLWSQSFPNPGADLDNARPKLKIDKHCNVYVGFNYYDSPGSFNSDIYVVKYDSTGIQEWIAAYNGPGNGADIFTGIALDEQNIFICGSASTSANNRFLTVKFNSSGEQLWASLHASDSFFQAYETAAAIITDNTGNAYTTGYTYNSNGNKDYTTIKYSADGNEEWIAVFDSNDGLDDYASALTIDNYGNVIVTGSINTNADRFDFATVKYDNTGIHVWTNYYSNGMNRDDVPVAIATDADRNIIVTGNSGAIPPLNFMDPARFPRLSPADSIITVKYDTDGNELWKISEYFSSTDPNIYVFLSSSTVAGLNLDGAGNIYIGGYRLEQSYNIGQNKYFLGYSYITNKYSPQGNIEWKRKYSSDLFNANNGSISIDLAVAFGLVVPKEDIVYITGGSAVTANSGGKSFAITTVKFSPCNITADAGSDQTILAGESVPLGRSPELNVIYSWEPAEGLSDANISSPVAAPSQTTTYILTAARGSGCIMTDTVTITVNPSSGTGDEAAEAGIREASIVLNEGTTVVLGGGWSLEGDAIMRNEGTLVLTGDWNNNSTSENALEGIGTVELSGDNSQRIKGSGVTGFNHLTISGTGVKVLQQDIRIGGVLNLQDKEFSIGDKTLLILNTDENAIQLKNGIITHTEGGKLVRYTETTGDYAFPLKNKNGDEIIFTQFDLAPGNPAKQGFSMKTLNTDGFAVTLYEKSASITENQTVNLKIKANLAEELKIKFDFDPEFNVSSVKYFDIKTNNFEPLDGEFFTVDKNNLTLNFTSIKPIGIKAGLLIPPTATEFNWEHTIIYGEGGAIAAESKQHFDLLGRPTQTQARNITEGVVLTSQTIYDAHGRAAIQTLPAPSGTTLSYKEKFITNAAGNNDYNYIHFDLPGTLNAPVPVNSNNGNTLGYQYSDNGESYVASSGYPYYRMEYTADPLGAPKRSAMPGEELRMGKERETKVHHMLSAGELSAVYGADKSYKVSIDATDKLMNSPADQAGGFIAEKHISIDADGKEQVFFTAGGQTIATCLSGVSTGCPHQNAVGNIPFEGTRSADIHLPAANKGDLKLPLPIYGIHWDGDENNPPYHIDIEVQAADIFYKITDLNTNQVLAEGTDYSIATDRSVSFYGKYATGSSFFRISVAFAQGIEDSFIAPPPQFFPPDVSVEYKLDYSHWAIGFYDFAGRLRKVVEPKGVDCNNGGAYSMYSAFDYDHLGSLIGKISPDEGKVEYLYDSEGKMRFSQTSKQNANAEFSYVNYDQEGRSIETGVFSETGGLEFNNYYNTTGATNVQTVIDQLDGLDDTYCSEKTTLLYDKLVSAEQIPAAYSYKSSYPQRFTNGRIIKTMNDENISWYSYDQVGRAKFIVQQTQDDVFTAQNTTADAQIKTIDYNYNLSTGVLLEKIYQEYNTAEKLTHEYLYDSDLRLKGSIAKDGTEAIVGEVNYEFYLDGSLKRKEIGGNLQGMDYVYTITGKLKSINHSSLDITKDPGADGSTSSLFHPDVFGLTLDYFNNDYSRSGTSVQSFTNTAYPGHYNGLVNAIRWKNSISNVIDRSGAGLTDLSLYSDGSVVHELAMLFQYDERNQLASSTFARYDNSAETAILLNPFKVYGENNGNIGYDANGNITSLLRDGYLAGGSNSPMDILSYTYADNSNKLISIADNSTSSINYNDFQTSGTQGMDYNDDGELVASAAEGVADIDYYATGRVKKIIYSDGNTAEYFYNERGEKTRQTFTDNNSAGTPSMHTWYMGDAEVSAIYEKDETSANPEAINLVEQPIYCAVRTGVYYKTAGKTLYEIADHLGNVRAVVSNNNGTPAVESWADYYPHGGVMPGRNAVTTPYRYNYQGTENALASRWKNFNLRMYNVDLGRFTTPDPYGQFYSSYLGMGNNPVSAIDPTGGYCLCAAESGDMAWENVPWEIYFGGYGDQWSTGIGGGSGGGAGSGGGYSGGGTVALLDGVIPLNATQTDLVVRNYDVEISEGNTAFTFSRAVDENGNPLTDWQAGAAGESKILKVINKINSAPLDESLIPPGSVWLHELPIEKLRSSGLGAKNLAIMANATNRSAANFQLQANLNDVYLGWGNLGFALIGQTEVLNIGSSVKFVSPRLLAIENPPGGMSGQNTWDPVDNVPHTRIYAVARPESNLRGNPNAVQQWNQNTGNRNRLYFGFQMVDYTGQPQWYYGSIPSNTRVIWAR